MRNILRKSFGIFILVHLFPAMAFMAWLVDRANDETLSKWYEPVLAGYALDVIVVLLMSGMFFSFSMLESD